MNLSNDNMDPRGCEVLMDMFKQREDREGVTLYMLAKLLRNALQKNGQLKECLQDRKKLAYDGNEKETWEL